jgi:hypothetical protein
MVTQLKVVEQVLATIGTVGITLADAVTAAEALKPMKNKNKTKNWENHFKANGNVVEGIVTQKTAVVVAPVTAVVATPEAVAPVVVKTE